MKGSPSDFLSNLFADMRDRGLLPIVGLLIVCLVAIPFLLGGGDDGSGGGEDSLTPSATVSSDALPGIETRPVVIASPAELRNYNKRLVSFQARNPFHQELSAPSGTGTPASDAVASTGTDTAGTTTGAGATTTPESPTSPTTPPTDPTTPPTDPTTPPTGGDTGGSSSTQLISIRIDVRAGVIGKTKRIKDVKGFDYLPDPQHPVVQFVGGDFNLSSVAFVVSSAVTATDGDGNCAPSPKRCQFLMMAKGDEQTFEYYGERYRLKLTDIKRHVEEVSSSDPAATASTESGKESPNPIQPTFTTEVTDEG